MKRGFALKWFTKVIKKVFSEEEHDREDLEKIEPPTYKEPKAPFRFPLISDDERGHFINGELDQELNEELLKKNQPDEKEPMPLYMHKQWQQNRQNTIIHHASKTVQEQSLKPTKTEVKPEISPRTNKVPVQSRVFKPTDVPSPVHGFHRPKVTPIQELLIGKVQKEINSETAVTIIEPSEISPSEPLLVKEEIVVEKNIKEASPEIIEVPIHVNKELEKVEVNSTVPVEKTIVTDKKKKSLPFNVLMLNSDKEKYQQKKTQEVANAVFSKEFAVRPVMQQPVVEKPVVEKPVESTVVESSTVLIAPVEIPSHQQQEGYTFPKQHYLVPPEQKTQDYEWMQMQADRLIESLSYFQVKAEIVQMVQGPAVTQFEMTVGNGTKVSKIRNLADDLKLALAAKDIRIQAPIPGKSSIGIEIPNRASRPVRLSEVVGSNDFTDSDSPLEAALGLDLTGKPVTIDLRKMPHGLIAGATGSGKSVCINSLLISLLYKATPKELNLLLIDPKMVELAPFNHIPHLVSPVITDVKAATAALKWAVEEMERRYQLFAHTGVRDITRYNAMADEKRQFAQKLPYLLIVIDELADLMMMAPTEVEEAICRIAQKARACGIHLVVATQRPSVDVITGLIKANIPTRIAFSVSSQIDSRTILDVQGAERLLGRGDMLYLGNGMSAPIRLQGTFVTDEEMEKIIDHARSQGEPSYLFEQEELVRRLEVAEDQDELFEEACRFILEQGSASTSLLQRKFHVGYNRAARLVDLMEQHGYVSEQRGSKAREVFITENDIILLFGE